MLVWPPCSLVSSSSFLLLLRAAACGVGRSSKGICAPRTGFSSCLLSSVHATSELTGDAAVHRNCQLRLQSEITSARM